MESLKTGSDVLFLLLEAIMVLAMHAGFAFLELGTVRSKNQVNALVKIFSDFPSPPSPISASGTESPTVSIFFTAPKHLPNAAATAR